MKRSQLEALLRELAHVLGKQEVAMIGSQCVHAATDAPPAEVLMSRECDILVEDSDPVRERIDAELGATSRYHEEHGTFVDTVSPTFPFLPAGWEQRAYGLTSGDMTTRCLELHDLVLSKLAAGRLKDNELIAALLERKLVPAAEKRFPGTSIKRPRPRVQLRARRLPVAAQTLLVLALRAFVRVYVAAHVIRGSCRPPTPKRPLSIGAGAVVIHDGRVLLVRNIRGVTKARYLLPAGRVDPSERPDQAAAREALEETNLRVAIEGLLGCGSGAWTTASTTTSSCSWRGCSRRRATCAPTWPRSTTRGSSPSPR